MPSQKTSPPDNNPSPGQLPPSQFLWRQIILFSLIFFLSWYWLGQLQAPRYINLTYSQFKEKIAADEVAEIFMRGQVVTGTLRNYSSLEDSSGTAKNIRFTTTLPPVGDQELLPLLQAHHVSISAQSTEAEWWKTGLLYLIPWLLIIGVFIFTSRLMQKGIGGGNSPFNFGKSKARHFRKGSIQVSFDDVAGLENAKRDLHEIIDFMKEPQYYQRVGAKIPTGILLMGPPGTGKTLLAKAVAGEADVPFYSISGSEFIEMFVGVGASRVRDMFAAAKKEAPAIIFIDEIDSVGRTRGTGLGGGHDEREQTLNQILSEMDGFAAETSVVILAATNRPDVLDPALLRPGRFDRKITLDLPRKEARQKILEVHSRNIPLADDIHLESLAATTVGFSGADLENLMNEAALLTGREKKKKVTAAILDQARDKIVFGAERENILNEDEKQRVAYHEAGHALMTCLLEHTDPVSKVTIIPRGRALGATEQQPEEDRFSLPESYLTDRLMVMLGGRVSEKIIYDEYSSGAADDLKQATRLARRMISQWGMSKNLGPVAFRRGEEHIFLGREMTQQRDFSEYTAQLIDNEVRDMLRQLEQAAEQLLLDNRQQLDRLTQALLEKELLVAKEILDIIGKPS